MKSLVGEYIQNLKPYVPGKPIEELERELGIAAAIKLASNENPLGTSPKAVEAIQEALVRSHYYPDAAAFQLKEKLGDYHQVHTNQLLIGNGSNELLTLAVRTFLNSGKDHSVIAEDSFNAYAIILQSHNIAFDKVSLDESLRYDLDAMLGAIRPDTKLVFIANPNNPTGTYIPGDALRKFLASIRDDIMVVVDEAYHHYVTAPDYQSALEMRDGHENLIVCRTFSKCYGLAGLRIGYAIAPASIIDYMNRVREPFNCNLIGQAAAVAALDDDVFLNQSVAVNESGRKMMEEGLAKMAPLGITWTPSQTNFLLVHTPFDAKVVYEAMLREGVIVRPMGGVRLKKDLRITIGTETQVKRCLQALKTVLVSLS